jgi:hypothetical protein
MFAICRWQSGNFNVREDALKEVEMANERFKIGKRRISPQTIGIALLIVITAVVFFKTKRKF